MAPAVGTPTAMAPTKVHSKGVRNNMFDETFL
jgi:hypothetical protein